MKNANPEQMRQVVSSLFVFGFLGLFLCGFLRAQELNPGSISEDLPSTPCVFPTLTHRTGRESCWAEFFASPQRRICIPKEVWHQWLQTDSPALICTDPSVRWRSYSFLYNSDHDYFNSSKNGLKKPAKKISLSQTLTSQSINKLWKQSASTIEHFSLQYRINSDCLFFWSQILKNIEIAREQISEFLAPHDSLGIFRSLVLNQNNPNGFLNSFRRLGFVHLVTATGIHLYVCISIALTVFKKLTQWAGFRPYTGFMISRIISTSLCGLLWVLTGARLGMLRPWVIILLRQMAMAFGFRFKKGSPLFFALLAESLAVLFHTWMGHKNSLQSGRWIYALAVGGGLYWNRTFGTHLGMAIGSWILVAFWEAWEIGTISIFTPLLSLVTLPVICTGIYPLILAGILFYWLGLIPVAEFIIKSLDFIIFFGMKWITEFSMISGNLWIVPRWAILIGLMMGVLWIGTKRIHMKFPLIRSIVALTLVIGLFLQRKYFIQNSVHDPVRVPVRSPAPVQSADISFIQFQNKYITGAYPSSHEARKIQQLDVGQGDAALVIGEQVGLIDTGSIHALSPDRWLELFAKQGISHIDWIALTHLDEDHAGGIQNLARILKIRCVVISLGELQTPRGRQLKTLLSDLGTQVKDWDSGCVPYPTWKPSLSKMKKNKNMGAVWVPLQSGGFYLSAGDSDFEDERKIGKWAKALSASRTSPRILKVSHHGSRYSTNNEFLLDIQPTEAWISVGNGNHYGHPSIPVLHRLGAFGIPVRRTDRDGKVENE